MSFSHKEIKKSHPVLLLNFDKITKETVEPSHRNINSGSHVTYITQNCKPMSIFGNRPFSALLQRLHQFLNYQKVPVFGTGKRFYRSLSLFKGC